jgi:iron-sulfur cluster repair protein YtfE (RIC family)
MENTLALIEQTIKEHEQIMTGIQASEGIANDVAAILELERPVEGFVVGRLDDRKKNLDNLHKSLEKIDKALGQHFGREEKTVLAAFERSSTSLTLAFSLLLEEHDDFRKRIVKSKEIASELLDASLSREVWEGKAYGLRAHIRHTRKHLEAHAASEAELFRALRKELQKG